MSDDSDPRRVHGITGQACASCIYFNPIPRNPMAAFGYNVDGTCHRSAPTEVRVGLGEPVNDDVPVGMWLWVSAADWCGEYDMRDDLADSH